MLSIFSCVCWPSVCLLWRNVYLGLPAIFLTGLFGFLILRFMSCLYILEINPLSIDSLANIFSHSKGCLFILFIVSFAVQKLLSFVRFHLLIFVFISITLGGGSRKIFLWFMSKSVLPVFTSKSFIVSGLTFRALINFEFIFVYGVVHFLLKISHYFHNYISFVQFLIDLFQQNCLFLHF